MFYTIPEAVRDRMRYLEELDARDRADSTPRIHRLRQIPAQTGRFIAILARCAPNGTCIEIGTSGGYSALWLGLACREAGQRLITFEVLDEKVRIAEETFRVAGMRDIIRLVHGDAVGELPNYGDIAFCFLDAEKEIYLECYELIIPRMVPGGILAADNAINHEAILRTMLDRALHDERVDALVVPIGNGVLVCRKV